MSRMLKLIVLCAVTGSLAYEALGNWAFPAGNADVGMTIGQNPHPIMPGALDGTYGHQGGTVSFKIKACCFANGFCAPGETVGVFVSYTITIVWRDAQNNVKVTTIQDGDSACTKCVTVAAAINGVNGTVQSISVNAFITCQCCDGDMEIGDPDYPHGDVGGSPVPD